MNVSRKFDAVAFLEGLYKPEQTRPVSLCYGAIWLDDLSEGWYSVFEAEARYRETRDGQAREHAEAEALAVVIERMNTLEKRR